MDVAWHDLVGGLGVLSIVGTYLGVQLDRVDARSVGYAAANALGAAFVLVSLSVDFNLSAALIEGFWLVASLIGLFRRFSGRTRDARGSSGSGA